MRTVTSVALAIAVLAVPAAAFAAGGHEGVGCAGCHGLRRGDAAGHFPSNTRYLNPKTNQPYTGTTGFCLTCHQEEKNGGKGFLPIARHASHPFGLATVNPKVAKVPPELMKDGRFECMSCHDPHPSNPNYRYLRANTGKKGEKMDQFCGVCHASKSDARVSGVEFFSSSDETAPRASGTAAPAAAARGAKK